MCGTVRPSFRHSTIQPTVCTEHMNIGAIHNLTARHRQLAHFPTAARRFLKNLAKRSLKSNFHVPLFRRFAINKCTDAGGLGTKREFGLASNSVLAGDASSSTESNSFGHFGTTIATSLVTGLSCVSNQEGHFTAETSVVNKHRTHRVAVWLRSLGWPMFVG